MQRRRVARWGPRASTEGGVEPDEAVKEESRRVVGEAIVGGGPSSGRVEERKEVVRAKVSEADVLGPWVPCFFLA